MRLMPAAAVIWSAAAVLHAASTPGLASIRQAGVLACGIDQSEAEYNLSEQHGPRVAFDQDLCRAVAVAILGPRAQVAVKGYPDSDTALEALQHKEVDLIASVSADFTHSTIAGVSLTRPVLFDAQGFLVLHSARIEHIADLDRKKICFLDQTESELNLHAWFARHQLSFKPFPFQEEGEMEAAFVTGNCAALSGDLTRLANARAAFASRAREYDLLPETIALDPLAMAYRSSDPAFGNILAQVFNVLVAAEELGVSSKNAGQLLASPAPEIQRLLGRTRELARPLALEDGWTAKVLSEVGNYGEIFGRGLGEGCPLKMPRGLNSLWSSGNGSGVQGLLFSLPLN
jgi:general L-amino acid transport system substrate-binding protein